MEDKIAIRFFVLCETFKRENVVSKEHFMNTFFYALDLGSTSYSKNWAVLLKSAKMFILFTETNSLKRKVAKLVFCFLVDIF